MASRPSAPNRNRYTTRVSPAAFNWKGFGSCDVSRRMRSAALIRLAAAKSAGLDFLTAPHAAHHFERFGERLVVLVEIAHAQPILAR